MYRAARARRVPAVNRVVRTAAAVVVGLALSGCGTTILVGQGEVAADVTGPADTSGAAAAEPTASAGAGSTANDGKTVTLGKATIPLTGVAKVTKDGDYLCLTLVNDTGCSLEVIDIGATRAAGGSVAGPAPGAPNGWWWGSDVPSCGSGSDGGPVAVSTVVEKGFKRVGPKNAAYAHWTVTCQNPDQNFDPRMWWLPTSKIAFREHDSVAGAAAAVDKLLDGVTFRT
jgi:hypothetical protein